MDRHHHNAHRAGLAAPERAPVVPAGLASLGTAGAAPAELSPPTKDEAPGWQAKGFRDQTKTDNANCASPTFGEQQSVDVSKSFTTLRARLALAGWVLTRTGAVSATFTASRWGRSTAEMRDLAAVEAFAGRVGAPS